MLALRDPVAYAKLKETLHEEDDITDNNIETVDKGPSFGNEDIAVPIPGVEGPQLSSIENITNDDADLDIYLANFDSIFENALWEVEVTDAVIFNTKKNNNHTI